MVRYTYRQFTDAPSFGPLTVRCAGCKQQVKGFESAVGSAGFYRLVGPWKKYGTAEQAGKVLCDSCMWRRKKYKEDFGIPCQQYAQLDPP